MPPPSMQSPEAKDELLARARRELEASRLVKALAAVEEILRDDPDHAAALGLRQECQRQLEDRRRRKDDAILDEARRLREQGDVEGARRACEGILAAHADHTAARDLLALLVAATEALPGAPPADGASADPVPEGAAPTAATAEAGPDAPPADTATASAPASAAPMPAAPATMVPEDQGGMPLPPPHAIPEPAAPAPAALPMQPTAIPEIAALPDLPPWEPPPPPTGATAGDAPSSAPSAWDELQASPAPRPPSTPPHRTFKAVPLPPRDEPRRGFPAVLAVGIGVIVVGGVLALVPWSKQDRAAPAATPARPPRNAADVEPRRPTDAPTDASASTEPAARTEHDPLPSAPSSDPLEGLAPLPPDSAPVPAPSPAATAEPELDHDAWAKKHDEEMARVKEELEADDRQEQERDRKIREAEQRAEEIRRRLNPFLTAPQIGGSEEVNVDDRLQLEADLAAAEEELRRLREEE